MDFLIVGIPPLDIVPSLTYTANGDTASLAALKTLVAQFNIGLSTFATSFSGQLSSGSKATFFDLAALVGWTDGEDERATDPSMILVARLLCQWGDIWNDGFSNNEHMLR